MAKYNDARDTISTSKLNGCKLPREQGLGMKSGKGVNPNPNPKVDGGGCVCCYVEIQQHPTIPPLEGQLERKYVLQTFIFLHSGEESQEVGC